MKLIEAMKQIKDLQRKAEDLRTKVSSASALTTVDTPVYPDQKGKVSEWVQGHSDILKEILRLRTAIQRTNLATQVTIELGEKQVTKSIAEWIHRRRDFAKMEREMWSKLTDRGLKEGMVNTPGGQTVEMKIVRFYDPVERDKNIDLYTSEPSKVDARLEVINAITDLME